MAIRRSSTSKAPASGRKSPAAKRPAAGKAKAKTAPRSGSTEARSTEAKSPKPKSPRPGSAGPGSAGAGSAGAGRRPARPPKPESNSIGMKLVPIPAGGFTMGSPATEKDRGTDEGRVRVEITRAFLIGRTVVTKGQWRAVMKSEPWKGQRCVTAGDDAPAVYVDWHDAVAFCRKLTALERAGGWLEKGEHYRLPTEAEWEYACRAGTTTPWSFGSDGRRLGEHAWFYGNTEEKREQYAHRVGRKKPNPWGLCDMHGNVYEWCSDWYKPVLAGGNDPHGPATGVTKVLRGGGWGYDPARCRSADRNKNDPSFSDFSGGFRVVLAAE